MRRFLIILAGYVISQLGSHLAGFALGVWILQRTGSMGMYAFVLLAYTLPPALLAPLAGAATDRWDRRPAMLFGLAGSCIASVTLVALAFLGLLATWSALLLIAAASCFVAFVIPAFESMTAVLVPSEQLTRANGLVQLGQGFSQLVAPITAGFLLPVIGLEGIYIIDVVTFVVALALIASVTVPSVERGVEPENELKIKADEHKGQDGEKDQGNESFWRSASAGWGHIRIRPGLVALLLLVGVGQLGFGMVEVLFTPLVLSFAGPEALGIVMSVGGVGFLAGGMLATVRRGPKTADRRGARLLLFAGA